MINKYLILSLAVAGLSFSAAGIAADSHASTPGQKSQMLFKVLDTNHDGQLTSAELAKLPDLIRKHRFDRLDSNGDGKIEKKEYLAWAEKRAERRFSHLDENDDGALTISEMNLQRYPHHRKGEASGHKNKAHHAWRHHRCMHHRHQHHGRFHRMNTDYMLARMDTNHDGYVSAAEWQKAWQKMHNRHHARSHHTES